MHNSGTHAEDRRKRLKYLISRLDAKVLEVQPPGEERRQRRWNFGERLRRFHDALKTNKDSSDPAPGAVTARRFEQYLVSASQTLAEGGVL